MLKLLTWARTFYIDTLASFSETVRYFYLTELAFYIQATVMLFFEPRTKDRPEMIVHHAATILLIFASYNA